MFSQGVGQHLQPLLRTVCTSSAANAAAPALAPKAGGFLSSIFGSGSRIDVPLNEPLPAVAEPPRGTPLKAAPVLQETRLASGSKLATLESASPISSLALFVEGGSSYETPATAGACKVLEAVAFKSSTMNRSTFRLTRELEKVGADARATAGREHVSFGVDYVRLNNREAVEMLVDSVVNARYTYWEVRDTLDVLKEQLAEQLRNPSVVLDEVLHRAAFDGALGNSLVVDPSQVSDFTNEKLQEYVASLWNPSRVVMAGVGVDHGEVKSLATPLLGSTAGATGAAAAPASKYVGGSLSVLAPSAPLTHVALAMEVKGGLGDTKAAALAAVVKALLDEARPTLPHSRKESSVFASLTPFASVYKSTGLVGVAASTSPAHANQLVDTVCKKVEALASGVSDASLAHAKALALGEYKAKTATSAGLLSVAGANLLATGKFDASELPSKIHSLTAADVIAFVKSSMKAPTFALYGNLASLPRIDVSKRFA